MIAYIVYALFANFVKIIIDIIIPIYLDFPLILLLVCHSFAFLPIYQFANQINRFFQNQFIRDDYQSIPFMIHIM